MNKKKKRAGQWIDDLEGAIGRHVHLETSDGCYREGRLTALGCREIQINGQARDVPTRVELNGDPNEYVEFATIARMTID